MFWGHFIEMFCFTTVYSQLSIYVNEEHILIV